MSAERPDARRSGLICLADFRPPDARSKFEVWKCSIEGLVSIDGEWVVDFGRALDGEFIRAWAPRNAATVVWMRTEAQLRIALAEVDLVDTTRALVEEFLDHNELGLALEAITEAIGHSGNASPVARQALMTSATLMAQDAGASRETHHDADETP